MERDKIKSKYYLHGSDGDSLFTTFSSKYSILGNSTYGLARSTYDITNPFDGSIHRSYDRANDKIRVEKEAKIARFATHGREMSNTAMAKYIATSDDTERHIKLKDVRFGEPVTGLIASRPGVYGVTSVHHIAGYKIVIKRFDDTSDDTVWYETPIRSSQCKFDKLEETIHEHLLEAIQRDLEWNRIK